MRESCAGDDEQRDAPNPMSATTATRIAMKTAAVHGLRLRAGAADALRVAVDRFAVRADTPPRRCDGSVAR